MSISRHKRHKRPRRGFHKMGGALKIKCSSCNREAVGIKGHVGRKHCTKYSQWEKV